MATLEHYESKLLSLDGSSFENLICDLLEKEYPVFHNFTHTGKTAGKLAARQGTPDIWFTTILQKRPNFEYIVCYVRRLVMKKTFYYWCS